MWLFHAHKILSLICTYSIQITGYRWAGQDGASTATYNLILNVEENEVLDTDGDGIVDCIDVELCDGLDNDGDGLIDEEMPDTDGDGIGDNADPDDNNDGFPEDTVLTKTGKK